MGIAEEQQRRLDALNGEGLEVPADATPLDFLFAIFRDNRQPMHRRMKAAAEAAPYVHPKLAVTAILEGEDFEARLKRAIEQSGKVIEARPAAQVAGPPVDIRPPPGRPRSEISKGLARATPPMLAIAKDELTNSC
jgi:hypothetical protein